jgi:hypothetical protein
MKYLLKFKKCITITINLYTLKVCSKWVGVAIKLCIYNVTFTSISTQTNEKCIKTDLFKQSLQKYNVRATMF